MNGNGHGRFTAFALALAATFALTGFTPGGATAAGNTPKPKVVKGSGEISAKVEEFRAVLGANNGTGPDQFPSGRREINWDAVPDEFAAPNALPSDFFNGPAEPRARGAILETPGDHVAVSANPDNPAGAAVRFGDINPSYVDRFRTFSAERLFSPVGSNVVNLRFAVPATSTRAAVRGFGAVYTSVDHKESAAFQYFDKRGKSLGKFAVPVSKNGFSFLGVRFTDPIVARVKIVYGNNKLGPNDSGKYDVAVMDDFIYGEPQALT